MFRDEIAATPRLRRSTTNRRHSSSDLNQYLKNGGQKVGGGLKGFRLFGRRGSNGSTDSGLVVGKNSSTVTGGTSVNTSSSTIGTNDSNKRSSWASPPLSLSSPSLMTPAEALVGGTAAAAASSSSTTATSNKRTFKGLLTFPTMLSSKATTTGGYSLAAALEELGRENDKALEGWNKHIVETPVAQQQPQHQQLRRPLKSCLKRPTNVGHSKRGSSSTAVDADAAATATVDRLPTAAVSTTTTPSRVDLSTRVPDKRRSATPSHIDLKTRVPDNRRRPPTPSYVDLSTNGPDTRRRPPTPSQQQFHRHQHHFQQQQQVPFVEKRVSGLSMPLPNNNHHHHHHHARTNLPPLQPKITTTTTTTSLAKSLQKTNNSKKATTTPSRSSRRRAQSPVRPPQQTFARQLTVPEAPSSPTPEHTSNDPAPATTTAPTPKRGSTSIPAPGTANKTSDKKKQKSKTSGGCSTTSSLTDDDTFVPDMSWDNGSFVSFNTRSTTTTSSTTNKLRPQHRLAGATVRPIGNTGFYDEMEFGFGHIRRNEQFYLNPSSSSAAAAASSSRGNTTTGPTRSSTSKLSAKGQSS